MTRWLAICLALTFAPPSLAQAPAIPRTPEGRPDFQGVWTNIFATPLERRAGMDKLVLTPAEERQEVAANLARAKAADPIDPMLGAASPESTFLARVRGEFRSSLVVEPANGRLPLTDEGRRLLAGLRSSGFEGPERRNIEERCLTGPGPTPIGSVGGGNFHQIVQTTNDIVITSELQSTVRIIGLARSHRPAALVSLAGDSIGRWELDTLVVETTGFRQADLRRAPMVRDKARVVERFTLISPNELFYEFTVEDPAVYSAPWKAEYSFIRDAGRLYESACHEANHALVNIPRGAREAERRAAKASKP